MPDVFTKANVEKASSRDCSDRYTFIRLFDHFRMSVKFRLYTEIKSISLGIFVFNNIAIVYLQTIITKTSWRHYIHKTSFDLLLDSIFLGRLSTIRSLELMVIFQSGPSKLVSSRLSLILYLCSDSYILWHKWTLFYISVCLYMNELKGNYLKVY